jgi:hypothetical protein
LEVTKLSIAIVERMISTLEIKLRQEYGMRLRRKQKLFLERGGPAPVCYGPRTVFLGDIEAAPGHRTPKTPKA